MTWKEYRPRPPFEYEHALRWWQKEIKEDKYANVAEYEHDGVKSYELDMQLEGRSLAINIKLFSYPTLDFEKFEKDARWILKRLKPKS